MKSKKPIIPSPFEKTDHMTEMGGVLDLVHWMRNIIEEKNLDLGLIDVETIGSDRKRPDAVIYEKRRSKNVLCVIEAKPPSFDVFNEEELKEPARQKATQRNAKYFALTNFKTLVWFKTDEVNALKPEEEQIVAKYQLSELENLDDIKHTRYSAPIKKALADFLIKLYSVHAGKEPEPKLAIDEFLVFRLQQKIEALSYYYKRIIDDRCHKDSSFAIKLKKWFFNQGWSFKWQLEDFDRAARQTAYLLVNKILFYNLLQTKRPDELDPLEIPAGLTKGALLQTNLQGYFDYVLKEIDYETIYTADFVDTIAFPDSEEVVKEIKELVKILKEYDFSTIGYDIIGRIFERLIPPDERHKLGQYFTSSDVVDLILRFCLQHEDDKIIDPSCGAGTFLVRAYQHKKIMNARLEHENVLETLWGNDIAKFPATLATINLAIKDLSVDKNYPNILQEDFFDLLVGDEGFEPVSWRKKRAKTLHIKERDVIHPRWFDVIIGNPPYTRQEEIPEIGVDKGKMIKNALYYNDKKIATISKRAGIHAYFFVHGTKFLKDGGYFGFIVSNSWLDVDYGKGLQELFLKNYQIIAVIESKVERWFEEADINTCIIILQKCKSKRERDQNLVRFVYLKKPLRHFIPPAQDEWEKQVERLNDIDNLKKTILAHNDLYENEELRIYPKSQKELWDEGFDPEKDKYIGAKWGKYLRAPEIFFKILKKGKDKLVPLKEIAKVRRGFTTGANKFFYLTEEEIKRRKIEKEFWMHRDENGEWVPNYVVKSPRECKAIEIKPEDLKYRVLMIHKDKEELIGTNVLRYIKAGERKKYHKRQTCKSKKRWYDLGERKPSTLGWPYMLRERIFAPSNSSLCYFDCEFFDVYSEDPKVMTILMNSSLFWLLVEIMARSYGGGGGPLKVQVYELKEIPIFIPSKLKQSTRKALINNTLVCSDRQISSIFLELGAFSPEEVSPDKVKPDRRELDKIIMGEILGLTDDEQLEVYRAVIDLVKSRLERAKSFGNSKKTKEGVDVDVFKDAVVEQIRRKT